MTLDIRTRQAGTLFSIGVEDEAPSRPRLAQPSLLQVLPRRIWSSLRMSFGGVDTQPADALVRRANPFR
jgi:hypothetical protein